MKREESCEQINISVCLRGRFPQLLWWELRIEAAAVASSVPGSYYDWLQASQDGRINQSEEDVEVVAS